MCRACATLSLLPPTLTYLATLPPRPPPPGPKLLGGLRSQKLADAPPILLSRTCPFAPGGELGTDLHPDQHVSYWLGLVQACLAVKTQHHPAAAAAVHEPRASLAPPRPRLPRPAGQQSVRRGPVARLSAPHYSTVFGTTPHSASPISSSRRGVPLSSLRS